jgi:hypothetical protein
MTSAHRMRWRTVMTVLALAWIVTFVVVAAVFN